MAEEGEVPGAPPEIAPGLRGVGDGWIGRGYDGPLLDIDIDTGGAVGPVDPGATEQHVVSRVAVERVVAVAADQHVVAIAAIGGELDRARREPRRLDDVIAGEAVDDDPIVRRLEADDVHPRTQSHHGDSS